MMENFHSKTLQRTFKMIRFVAKVVREEPGVALNKKTGRPWLVLCRG